MAFVTLLAIAVGTLSAIALLAVGLVEAPWQLLLVGLLAALYGLQRQVGTSEPLAQADSVVAAPLVTTKIPVGSASTAKPAGSESGDGVAEASAASADDYQLTYRGIRYRTPKS
jgi:hypothetical protein